MNKLENLYENVCIKNKEALNEYELTRMKIEMSRLLKTLGYDQLSRDIINSTQQDMKKYLNIIRARFAGSSLNDSEKQNAKKLCDKLENILNR